MMSTSDGDKVVHPIVVIKVDGLCSALHRQNIQFWPWLNCSTGVENVCLRKL